MNHHDTSFDDMREPAPMGPVQRLKRRFFAMRNGVIADTLRRSGAPYRMVFGLNLPQVSEIAADTAPDAALAEQMHADTATRESQLLAPMLMPVEAMDADKALRWLGEAPTVEAVDVMCHRLLRHMPEAMAVARRALQSSEPMMRYGAVRLMWNLIGGHAAEIRPLAQAESADGSAPAAAALARALVEEIDFLQSC